MKHKILILFFLAFAFGLSGQTPLYTTGITFCNGVPAHNPGNNGAKYAIDTSTWDLYVRSYGTTWSKAGDWLQFRTGTGTPAAPPSKFESVFAINAADSLYYYDGATWNHLNPTSTGGITGSGLANRLAYWTAAGALGYGEAFSVDTTTRTLSLGISTHPGILAFTDTTTSHPFITVDGVRFLHTIDYAASTLANQNLFLGHQSGNLTMTGVRNMGIGYNTLASITSGTRNFVFGNGSGDAITTGTNNIAIGDNTLGGCSTCLSNTAIGTGALATSTVGNYNTIIGESSATGGSYAASNNVILGAQSGSSITSSSANVLIGGRFTGLGLTTGGSNILIGFQVGDDITTGTNNTMLGTQAASASSTTALSGTVLLGFQAGQSNTASNVLFIDNSNTAAPLVGGNFSTNRVGINTTVANLASTLHVTGGGATSATYSLIITDSGAATATAAVVTNDSGQTSFGTNAPVASAKVQVESTTQGFMPPRMTTAQRDAIATPAAGLIIYNTSTNKHQGYDGTNWNDFY